MGCGDEGVNDLTFLRIRNALCEWSVVGDLDEYAAFVAREVHIARERYARKQKEDAA